MAVSSTTVLDPIARFFIFLPDVPLYWYSLMAMVMGMVRMTKMATTIGMVMATAMTTASAMAMTMTMMMVTATAMATALQW